MKTDVLVVGGGLAGAAAALAARARGRTVHLVRRGPGLTALGSGALEVAPDTGGGRRPVTACVETLARRSGHPYAVVGPEGRAQLPAAVAALAEALGAVRHVLSAYDGAAPNHLLPTPAGALREAAVAEASMVGLGLGGAERVRVGVVDLVRVASVDPALVLRGLAAAPGAVEVEGIEAAWPGDEDAPLFGPADLGRRLDDAAGRAALAEALRPGVDAGKPTHLLLPPIAGTAGADEVVRGLGESLGCRVIEGLGGEASLPGLRLHRALEAACAAAGVEVRIGTVAADGDALVLTEGRGDPEAVDAAATILATGRYLGGGVTRHGRFAEPVLGLPIFAGARWLRDDVLEHLTRDDPFAPQAPFAAGIRVDGHLRPLGPDGRPVRENLFAAGSLLGGYDGPRDRCGGGVAVLTGHLAGRLAAGEEIDR